MAEAASRRATPGRRARVAAGAFLAALAAVASGCGYDLAGRFNALPPEIQVIAVPNFDNVTERAEIDQRVTDAVAEKLSTRGRYDVVTSLEAEYDAILEGTVVSYLVQPADFGEDGRATSYRVTLAARAELRWKGGRSIWKNDNFQFIQNYDQVVVESGSQTFERELGVLDELAREFADSLVTSMLEDF